MRATTHTMAFVPPHQSAGQRLRAIVQGAVRQRRHLAKQGISQPVDTSRLVMWLDRNPWPSEATVRAFPLIGDLVAAMPHHPAGKKMLDEVRQMTAYRPDTNQLNHR